jgi:hypothetical protein
MSEIAPLVVGSEKSSCIFGGWPSFHDAEVHEIQLECGHIVISIRSAGLRLSTSNRKLHLWLMTNDVDQKGYCISTKHTLRSNSHSLKPGIGVPQSQSGLPQRT